MLTLGVRGWLLVPVVRMMRELEKSGSFPVRIARGSAHKCTRREGRGAAHMDHQCMHIHMFISHKCIC